MLHVFLDNSTGFPIATGCYCFLFFWQELLEKVRKLESHVFQLKNILAKRENLTSPERKRRKERQLDFSKWVNYFNLTSFFGLNSHLTMDGTSPLGPWLGMALNSWRRVGSCIRCMLHGFCNSLMYSPHPKAGEGEVGGANQSSSLQTGENVFFSWGCLVASLTAADAASWVTLGPSHAGNLCNKGGLLVSGSIMSNWLLTLLLSLCAA